jgi:dGTPase
LGHPPFGHAGERKLNELMKKYGGFEGNAQTLRLIADIFYRDNDHHRGMNPTRAFLDGILKYKASFKEFKNPENHFIYDEQKKYIDFVFAGSSIPKNISRPDKINSFRSIECQIMDWADDTAYAINDLVDSISGGFITIPKLIQWKEEKAQSDFQKQIIDEIIEWITKSIFKKKFGAQIGVFVSACGLREEKNFMSGSTNRYKYSLTIKDDILERAKVYKTISVDLVFRSSQLHQIEYKGNLMIEQLFDLFFTNYVNNAKGIKLLPDFNDQILNSEKTTKRRARLICDYIAGATDGYAMRLYRRMFDPDYSSISDLV